MSKAVLKYLAWVIGLGFVLYNSVYFKRLDEAKTATVSSFDAAGYAQNFWKTKLLPATEKATDLNTLVPLLKTDPNKAFSTYSNALGIGNIRYFLVKGQGRIIDVQPDEVTLEVPAGSGVQPIKLIMELIYGNAVRDASGIIRIQDFETTADLNALSEQLNKIVRENVVSTAKTQLRKGSEISFVGAIELNKAHLKLHELEMIPIVIKAP